MIIIGIDPSLTATGIARVATDAWRTDVIPEVCTITSKGKADATLAQRHDRLRDLASAISDQVHTADLVVIEAPSLGQARQGGTLDRNGLWWLIVAFLMADNLPVAAITPAQRAKYATGKGNAAKDTVLLEVARRFPHVGVTNNNEADALVLAAMGADHAGRPLVELPKVHREALDKVAWPVNVPVGGLARGVAL